MERVKIAAWTQFRQLHLQRRRGIAQLGSSTRVPTHYCNDAKAGMHHSAAECENEPRFKVVPGSLPLKRRFEAYADLAKLKLSSFVVLTTLAGYTLPSMEAMDIKTLIMACMGTALCSFSANTFNQWIEVPFDAQMARTRNRVLPRHSVTSLHAFLFGSACGAVGSLILFNINWMAGSIGLFNIFLYAGLYTPLKRMTYWNTWVGSVVGALPPLIGSCAHSISDLSQPSTWILPAVLFAWQFPHFNSLSWKYRRDYSKAGYHMLSVLDPSKNSAVSLRYALWMFPISFTSSLLVGFTTPLFLVDSSILNTAFVYFAFQFHKERTDQAARKLFFFSLVFLPAYMALMIIHKRRNDPNTSKNFAKAHEQTGNPSACMQPFD